MSVAYVARSTGGGYHLYGCVIIRPRWRQETALPR
jgi:hypothetical protein